MALPTLLLLYAFIASFRLARGASGTEPSPQFVYRADKISPEDLKLQGAFYPRGLDGTRPTQPVLDFSLYNHVLGSPTGTGRTNSAFVSTTKSEAAARQFLSLRLNSVGYIYKIHVTPNFYDVAGSLGKYYMHGVEQEVAALGKVQLPQVIGWIQFREGVEQPYVENPDYEQGIYGTKSWGGAEPLLAGFPKNHPAWRHDPWKKVKSNSPVRGPCIESRKRELVCNVIIFESQEEEQLGSKATKMVREADDEAKKLFSEFSMKFGLRLMAKDNWHLELSEVHSRFKYIQDPLVASRPKILDWAPREVTNTATNMAFDEVVNSSLRKMSDLERVAVLTSILPGIGCAFQAYAAKERGDPDAVDIYMCLAADVLLMNGFGLPSQALDALRTIRKKYQMSGLPQKDEIRRQRDEGWDAYQQNMTDYLDSTDFINMVKSQYMAEMAGVMFEAAETLGELHVFKKHTLEVIRDPEERRQLEDSFKQHDGWIRSEMSAQAFRRNEFLKMELPNLILRSLQKQAGLYNSLFINAFDLDVKNHKYVDFVPWAFTGGQGAIKSRSKNIIRDLLAHPPKTPESGIISHRVHAVLSTLVTPSICTEYLPDERIAYHCGDPSDGDDYPSGSPWCLDLDCEIYRPPKYQSGCELDYSYNADDGTCRKRPGETKKTYSTQTVKINTLAKGSQLPCQKPDGTIDPSCGGGPSDGDNYPSGSSRCEDAACTVYKPPSAKSSCDLGYSYDPKSRKCRRLPGSS